MGTARTDQTDRRTADAPRVERRLGCASFSSRRLGVRFKGGEVSLLVSVSPSLSDRVISLWNITPQFNSISSHWLPNNFICVKSNVYLLIFSILAKIKMDSYSFGSQMLEWGYITCDPITGSEREIGSFREAFVQLLLLLALLANTAQ